MKINATKTLRNYSPIISGVFIYLIILSLALSSSGQKVYKLGAIPTLSLNKGEKLLSVKILDIPKETTLSLVTVREDLSNKKLNLTKDILTFEPSDTDIFEFMIGIRYNAKIDTVRIIPYYPLTPEFQTIRSSGILPNPGSNFYIKINTETSKEDVNWNHYLTKTRKISISGKNLLFDANVDNGLMKQLKQNNTDSICNHDITSLDIYCDTLRLNTKLWIPQADISVHCRVLILSKVKPSEVSAGINGFFKTTPLDFPSGRKANEYQLDGEVGLQAGSIQIFSQSIINESKEKILFVADGGTGQDGGPGKVGEDKSNIPIGEKFSDYRGYFIFWPNYFDQHTVDNVIYSERINGQIRGSKSTVPLQGGTAFAPGHGGIGGKGGEITIEGTVLPPGTYWQNLPGKQGSVFGSKSGKYLTYEGGNGQVANWVECNGPPFQFEEGGYFNKTRISVNHTYKIISKNGQKGFAFPPPVVDGFKSWIHYTLLSNKISEIEQRLKKHGLVVERITYNAKHTDADNFADTYSIEANVWLHTPLGSSQSVEEYEFSYDVDSIKKYSELGEVNLYYNNVFLKNHFTELYDRIGYPQNGNVVIQKTSTNTWLSPQFVETETDYIKDIYLSGDLTKTLLYADRLDCDIRNAVKDLNNQFYNELSTQLVSINAIRTRAASNLDYFGNPAGFSPLLNLWVNKKIFEKSIEESISNIILCRRILADEAKNLDQQVNFSNLLSELGNQIQLCYANYDAYNINLNRLLNDDALIVAEIAVLQNKIQLKEDDLLKIAQKEVEMAHQVPFLKKALGVLSTACKVIPIYQPALGAIGTGLDFVNNLNTDAPLENLKNIPDFYSVLNDKGFKDSKKNFDDKIAQFKKGSKNFLTYGKDMLKIYNNDVAPAMQKIIETAKESQIDAKEIYAKLEEIKATFPDYKELADLLITLTDKKVDFNRQIMDFNNKVGSAQEEILQKLLQSSKIESSARDLSSKGISMEIRGLISAIEKRELGRLLEYQYYLAKSYEYRMLESYPNKLSFENELNALLKSVSGIPDTTNDKDRIQAIKMIYRNLTKNVVDRFVSKLQNERFVHIETPVSFSLDKNQLKELNEKRKTIIDLEQSFNVFGLDNSQANRIIYDINIKNPKATFPNQKGNIVTSLSINNNAGYTAYGGKRYKFFLGNGTKPLFKTVVNTNIDFPKVQTKNIDRFTLNEFLAITGVDMPSENDKNDIRNIFTHPLLETKLVLEDKSAQDVRYTQVVLEITYGYIPENGFNYLQLLNDEATSPKITITELNSGETKYYIGKFQYIFKNTDKIRITAQQYFGKTIFDHWENERGAVVSSLKELDIATADYTILKPIYK